ncbi:MAG TPA: hypothetical protein DGG94_05670 [Micromonosporaceae bacterium]|nr:hypothetical protein [Micromonosporaceae bacterium]HCU49288.1 hypothetical protein [Micromonosporaceae bacterium]
MDAGEIARQRMHSQRLWGEPFAGPEETVRALGAVQAQEYMPATWSIAARAGSDKAAVDQALTDGTILRTHLLRPTWHFVHRDDIRWLLELTAPRINALNAYYYRKFRLDDEEFERANSLLAKVLRGGNQLSRRELAPLFPEATGIHLGYILMRAELDQVICSGAGRTYALFDERVPPGKPWERERALAELARRYFGTRGPATTVKDFAQWSSLSIADCKLALDLVRETVPNKEIVADRGHRIDLIQCYDEVVMSYSESRDALMLPGVKVPEAHLLHLILLDGQLIGAWKPGTRKGIETEFFRALNAEEQSAFAEAENRFHEFLG